jgi:DNA-binding CsgD family transcriptional regulator
MATRQHEYSREGSVVWARAAELVAALDAAMSRSAIDAGQDGQLLDVEINGVRCRCQRTHQSPGLQVILSPRERQIVRMVARGDTNDAMARVLGISRWTVSTHLRRIFTKLGVNSRAAMVAGVLALDDVAVQCGVGSDHAARRP